MQLVPKPRNSISMSLTPKQLRFVQEYLVDLNAAEAYRRAGYKSQGKAAGDNAARLIANDSIAKAIADAQADRARSSSITAERVLREIAAVAFSDISELVEFTANGINLRNPDAITEAARRAIGSIKIRREGGTDFKPPADVIEFKLWPKVQALQQLAQHLGLAKHVHEHTGKLQLEITETIVDGPQKADVPAGTQQKNT